MPSPISSYMSAYQAQCYNKPQNTGKSMDSGVQHGNGESKSASAGITYNLRQAVAATNAEHGSHIDVDVNRRGDAAGLVLNLLV